MQATHTAPPSKFGRLNEITLKYQVTVEKYTQPANTQQEHTDSSHSCSIK